MAAAGCAPVNREQLAEEVAKADPEFSSTLAKHRELTNRLETFERELQLKRTTVERRIQQLRQDLASAAKSLRARVAEIKRLMEPDRRRYELELGLAGEELRAKRSQRASLGRQIVRLKKLGDAKHEAQLKEYLQDAGRLDQEMVGLRRHVRLLKLKLLLIKL
ncbi:MAG: hypothetical protein HY601_01355 [Candidatus Omnitrophica bacterium]|nr:hypothetical protein [Candidatus Omnitrophota bacterium]